MVDPVSLDALRTVVARHPAGRALTADAAAIQLRAVEALQLLERGAIGLDPEHLDALDWVLEEYGMACGPSRRRALDAEAERRYELAADALATLARPRAA